MTAPNQELQIDIVSDVVCPWCVIGYRQLAAALEATGTPYVIRWHPFELNPDMPPEGQNLREHVAEKYGTTKAQSEQSRVNIRLVGVWRQMVRHSVGADIARTACFSTAADCAGRAHAKSAAQIAMTLLSHTCAKAHKVH